MTAGIGSVKNMGSRVNRPLPIHALPSSPGYYFARYRATIRVETPVSTLVCSPTATIFPSVCISRPVTPKVASEPPVPKAVSNSPFASSRAKPERPPTTIRPFDWRAIACGSFTFWPPNVNFVELKEESATPVSLKRNNSAEAGSAGEQPARIILSETHSDECRGVGVACRLPCFLHIGHQRRRPFDLFETASG